MKKNTIISLLLAAVALCSVFAVSCNKKPEIELVFTDIAGAVAGAVPENEKFSERDSSYPFNFLGVSADEFANHTVMQHTSGDLIDEYGIIEAKDANELDKAKKFADDYLAFYRDTLWDERYKQDQYPKLRDAEVRTVGDRFVVYVIMDESSKSLVFSALDTLLNP